MSISSEDLVQMMKMKASIENESEEAAEIIPANLYNQLKRISKQARKVRKLVAPRNSTRRVVLKGKNLRTQLKTVHQQVLHLERVGKKNDAALRKSLQTTNKDVSKIKAKNKLQDHRIKGQEGALDALMMHRLFTSMLPPKLKRLKLSIDLGPQPVTDTGFETSDDVVSFIALDNAISRAIKNEEAGVEIVKNEEDNRHTLILDTSVLSSEYDATHDLMLNMISGVWKSYKGATSSFIMPMLMNSMNKGKTDGGTDKNMQMMMLLMSMNQKSE
mgnify:CR=1 FL=1